MAQLFRNNAFSNLGASLTNVATTLTVTTGHGDRFPVVAAPDFFLLTLQDASNNIEIVRVTARTAGSDSMTIQRAQEGTSARAWNIGDVVELRLTASALGPLSLLEGASTAASIRTILDVPTRTGGDASGTWNISITGNAATATTTTGNAATATKLQTARTINGTSFDGSANITTANWGTARTITIGNTGKSVDGSSNVSWSLEEIGVPIPTAVAGGTADAITASFTPAITALTNGMTIFVRAASANATTTPTFTPNSGTIAAKGIVKGAGAALVPGNISGAGHWLALQYDQTLDKWVLLNPAPVAFTRTKFTSGSGTYNTPAGARQLLVRMVGGGGGGGGGGTTGSGYGGVGGDTSFNSVVAKGGNAGAPTGGSGGTGGINGTGTATFRCGGNSGANGFPAWSAGGSTAGGIGGGSVFAGSGGSGASGAANTGAGGSGGPSSGTATGGGGGGGEYVEIVINNPAASYAYAIGAGGSAGVAGSSGFVGGAGGSGVIEITEFY